MRINKYFMPGISLVALLATVAAAQLAGVWQVTGSTTVIPVDASGRPDPLAIKGKMTLEDIIVQYQVPAEYLYAALELPADLPVSTQLKELESVIPNFEIDRVRQLVADYYAAHP